MIVKLNLRGQILIAISILLTSLSVLLQSPTLIIFTTITITYIISYPLYVREFKPPKLSMNAEFKHGILYRGEVEILHIEIINHSETLVPIAKLELHLPNSMYYVNRGGRYMVSIEPNSITEINLPLLPTSRGSHQLGPITLSIGDTFFIFEREMCRIDTLNMRVYPKRLGYRVPKSDSRKVFQKMIGLFATTIKGMGTDFHGLRDYIRGDPSKIVDWAATARRSKLISREYEDEKILEVVIALASGTTTRGSKFDFMLGLTLDIFEGIVKANHPASVVIFEEKIIKEFKATRSERKKSSIWAQIYNIIPKDVYADYSSLSNWAIKKGKTGDLFIVIGDLENDMTEIENMVRDIKMRQNHCIFIDVFGYSFNYEEEVIDAAQDNASSNYGVILGEVIGKGIKQDHIFRGLEMKSRLGKYQGVYGFIEGPKDNIINSLNRALFGYFGKKWSDKS